MAESLVSCLSEPEQREGEESRLSPGSHFDLGKRNPSLKPTWITDLFIIAQDDKTMYMNAGEEYKQLGR
jgi:hypothetical protein